MDLFSVLESTSIWIIRNGAEFGVVDLLHWRTTLIESGADSTVLTVGLYRTTTKRKRRMVNLILGRYS